MALLFLTNFYTISIIFSSFIMFVTKTKWESHQNKAINFDNICHYHWNKMSTKIVFPFFLKVSALIKFNFFYHLF
jgi:hypothetical protein